MHFVVAQKEFAVPTATETGTWTRPKRRAKMRQQRRSSAPKKKDRWTLAQTIRLLHAYEAEECLWNYSLPTYRLRHLRERAENNVVAALNIEGLTVKDVAAKWKTVRSAYARELARLRREEPRSAAGAEEHPKTELPWFNAASFLRNFIRPRKSTSNLEVSTLKTALINAGQGSSLSSCQVSSGNGHVDERYCELKQFITRRGLNKNVLCLLSLVGHAASSCRALLASSRPSALSLSKRSVVGLAADFGSSARGLQQERGRGRTDENKPTAVARSSEKQRLYSFHEGRVFMPEPSRLVSGAL